MVPQRVSVILDTQFKRMNGSVKVSKIWINKRYTKCYALNWCISTHNYYYLQPQSYQSINQSINQLINQSCVSECPKGTFKSLIGNKGCTPCPEYSTSEAGSTSVDQCECQHGEFQIFSEQSRKCQRYENEELMRFGNPDHFKSLTFFGIQKSHMNESTAKLWGH